MSTGDASLETVSPRSVCVDDHGVALPVQGSGHYASKEYWDSRFASEEAKEWLCSYADVRESIEALVPRGPRRILLVGCGNSAFGAELVGAGYKDVVASDFSETVVAMMDARHAAIAGLRYVVADMLNLPYDGVFDVIIDKAGFDAVVADGGADKWTPTDAARTAATKLNASVGRALRDGGTFIQITFAQPHFRRSLLEATAAPPWASCAARPVNVGLGYTLLAFERAPRV